MAEAVMASPALLLLLPLAQDRAEIVGSAQCPFTLRPNPTDRLEHEP
jgi:hypothetical protein